MLGTSKAAERYKVGKRMTDFLLEILNLNKTEIISIDIISNQEFTEVVEPLLFGCSFHFIHVGTEINMSNPMSWIFYRIDSLIKH